jgi:hypothetical protein
MKNESQNNSSTTDTPTNSTTRIRIVKVGNCITLSGKGKLQYHLGTRDNEILFRVYENSGSGFFSSEWISMSRIQEVSNRILPLDSPVTSYLLLNPVYIGRSQNSPAFLMAVLKQEGLVVLVENDERVYYRTDGAEFYAKVKELIESDVDIKILEKPKSSSIKTSDSKPEVIFKKSASKSPKKKLIEQPE